MKILILFLCLPFFIFSQSIKFSNYQSSSLKFNSASLQQTKVQICQNSTSDATMNISTNLNDFSGKNEAATQKIFKKEYLTDIAHTKKFVQFGFYLKYGANIISIVSQLKSYEGASMKESVENNAPLLDLSKRTTFLNALDFAIYGLELQSINSIGLAGNSLLKLSSHFPKDQSLYLYDAARGLKQARTFGLIGEGLTIIGSTIAFYGLGQRLDSDTFNKSMIIGGSFGLGAVIFKYISVGKIGSAGENIMHFSNDISNDLQKNSFKDFGQCLTDYKNYWRSGLTSKIMGISLIALSPFLASGENSTFIGTMIGGSILFLIGNIYTEWIAPYSFESASEKLSDIEHILKK